MKIFTVSPFHAMKESSDGSENKKERDYSSIDLIQVGGENKRTLLNGPLFYLSFPFLYSIYCLVHGQIVPINNETCVILLYEC